MAKLKIGNKNIAKKMLGTKEILKEVFNGSVIYEKVVGGNYITFSSPNSFTVAKSSDGYEIDGTLEYSTDTITWNTWDGSEIISVFNKGTYNIYLRGSNNTYVHGKLARGEYQKALNLTGSNISCNGNIENLLDYQTVKNGGHPAMGKNCFASLFKGCSQLIQVPELPATTLAINCYFQLFYNCTSLTTAPELPATTLANSCYSSMFGGCTSLVVSPKLPATDLTLTCYTSMFYGCTSLVYVPKLAGVSFPAAATNNKVYQFMFQGCTSLYISDTQTVEAPYAWTLPTSGTFTTTQNQPSMFTNCLGTRTSNDMAGEAGQSYTYYTQNPPVGD